MSIPDTLLDTYKVFGMDMDGHFDGKPGLPLVVVYWTNMAKGKAKNIIIKLVSTAGTGFFYTTTKNPKNMGTKKLLLKKANE